MPRQQKGFFGIGVPSLKVLTTLLLDSRGLLTLSPILIMGAIGTVMLYKRGRRAEALAIAGICLCFLFYNSGYYLPFGGGFMGPRFLDTLLPFLAFPVALTLKRFPGPTIALAAVSITTTVIATTTHPLVGYENETVTWMRYLSKSLFQPTIASAYGLGRGWGGIWPFFLAAAAAIVLAIWATPRLRLTGSTLWWGLVRSPGGACSRRSRPPCWGSTTPAWRASTAPATTPPSTWRCTPAAGTRWTRSPPPPSSSACSPSARCAWCATSPTGPRAGGVPAPARGRSRRSAADQLRTVLTLHFAACSWRHTTT